jgi:hypothetical protein
MVGWLVEVGQGRLTGREQIEVDLEAIEGPSMTVANVRGPSEDKRDLGNGGDEI